MRKIRLKLKKMAIITLIIVVLLIATVPGNIFFKLDKSAEWTIARDYGLELYEDKACIIIMDTFDIGNISRYSTSDWSIGYLKNIGNSKISVFWNASDVLTGFILTMEYNNGTMWLEWIQNTNAFDMAKNEVVPVRLKVTAGNVSVGDYDCEIHFFIGKVPEYLVPTIVLLIASDIYSSVYSSILSYSNDLEKKGYHTIIINSTYKQPNDIRTFLIESYNTKRLKGAVLVGSIPIFWFEMYETTRANVLKFPCDLYYMDLNGFWNDTDGNGICDMHIGLREPEIWIGRIKFDKMQLYLPEGEYFEESTLINNFFEKLKGGKVSNLKNLLILTTVAGLPYDYWREKYLDDLPSSETIVYQGENATRENYLQEIWNTPYKIVHITGHGGYVMHYLEGNNQNDCSEYNRVGPDHITIPRGKPPKPLFYWFDCCYCGRYTAKDNIAKWYLNSGNAIALVAMTKISGDVKYKNIFYDNIEKGYSIGEAFKTWYSYRIKNPIADENGIYGPNKSYLEGTFYGITLLGCPTMKLN